MKPAHYLLLGIGTLLGAGITWLINLPSGEPVTAPSAISTEESLSLLLAQRRIAELEERLTNLENRAYPVPTASEESA